MQVDMHFYGTYALARAAGLKEEIALRIAEAAQYVDDYTEEEDIEASDGALIAYWPSGHEMTSIENFDVANMDKADPHRVWVPFHFLPAGEGASYEEKMRCGKDSVIAQAAIANVLARANEPFAPELVGVMAHIYADTFSHYGFSGLRSNGNLVHPESIEIHDADENLLGYLKNKADSFLGAIAETSTRGLGHAAVADYPDRPFLKWQFTYEDGRKSPLRDNHETYVEGCEKLFRFFSNFKMAAPQYAEDAAERSFDAIAGKTREILAHKGKKEERIGKWQSAAANGELNFSGGIPEYDGNSISAELRAVRQKQASDLHSERIWHFARAIEVMRGLIINELLPQHNLIG